ncbi:MAG: type II secretion system protein GspE [Chitinivibrionales bacterium]|nr:type II secretion system protein GspE [Chitinivibrionales bacterium]MBD3358720.1 type II secretion system protein GspE [Chitinivibrionales bacterium]
MADISATGGSKGLGERLIDLKIITPEQLALATSEQRRDGGSLGEVLEKLGFVSQTEIARQLAEDLNTEFIDLSSTVIDGEVLRIVPPEFAKQHQVVPLDRDGGNLTVAMANPYDVMAIDALEKLTAMRVEVIATSPQAIHEAIERKYLQGVTIEDLIDRVLASSATDQDNASAADSPGVQLVNQIIARAAQKRATDVHLEPQQSAMRLRLRIDGLLHEEMLLPQALQSVIIARIKIMSGLDVTEHRLPQDGKIPFKLGHKRIDIRVSCLPTQYGESLVLRILDKSSLTLTLKRLGIAPREQEMLLDAIGQPHGIILVTGPTGSGKTTTLYAALRQMDAVRNSIFTLEDPVEYELPNVRQTQINAEIGMTFAGGLRALLRQDPDIILVGEIRDEETAQLAVRAALTGHLVLSTLHTNSAAGAIPRLINMGVEPFVLRSTLIAVVAQRLVRKMCPRCKSPMPDVDRYAERLHFEMRPGDSFMRGRGCSLCLQSGYVGRMAVYEILHGDYLKDIALRTDIDESVITEGARTAGMRFMIDDGIEKARAGKCCLEDIIRVVGT